MEIDSRRLILRTPQTTTTKLFDLEVRTHEYATMKYMKSLNLDRRSKIVYGISAVLFFSAIGFCIAGLTDTGSFLGVIGVSLAIGNDYRQRQLLAKKDSAKVSGS